MSMNESLMREALPQGRRSATSRVWRAADRLLSLAGNRAPEDRARAELMEPAVRADTRHDR